MGRDVQPSRSERKSRTLLGKRHVLDLVPMWFRSRWPLRRFYWQAEELEEIKRGVREVRAQWFGGDGGWPNG